MTAHTDSRIFAALVKGVLLVVKCGTTSREHLQHAQSGIRSVDGNLIGVVLNNVDIRTNGYYNYGPYGPNTGPPPQETFTPPNYQMPFQHKPRDCSIPCLPCLCCFYL